MNGIAKWLCAIGLSVGPVACSPGADTLLHDGHAAMESLDTPTVDTVLVEKGIASLVRFSEDYQSDPRADSARFMLGSLYTVLGRNPSATETFVTLINTYPGSRFRANSIILAGHLFEEMGSYEKAKASFERLIREYPNHDFVTNGSAQALIDHMGEPIEEWLIPFNGDSTATPTRPGATRPSV